MSKEMKIDSVLYRALSTRRKAGSKAELEFRTKYLPNIIDGNLDGYGNAYKLIYKPDGTLPATIFTAHTDTVAQLQGNQPVFIDEHHIITTNGKDVLGADDGAGVALLAHMIRNDVPGLYVFHAEEECGGNGAEYFVDNTLPMFEHIFERAIAFDRMDNYDVITHMCERTCSDIFAQSLAKALNMNFEPDATGIFTDTALYTDAVGECTNLSVGYRNHHTRGETLDYAHYVELAEALLKVDWEALPTKRQPGEIDEDEPGYRVSQFRRHTSGAARELDWHEVYNWVVENPEEATDMLINAGLASAQEDFDFGDQDEHYYAYS